MVFVGIATCFIGVSIILLAAIKPRSSAYSQFELKRRSRLGDNKATVELERAIFTPTIIAVREALIAFLLILFTMLSITWLGLIGGGLLSLLFAVGYRFSVFGFMYHLTQKLYEPRERAIISFLKRHPQLARVFQGRSTNALGKQLGSKEELLHELGKADRWLSGSEKRRLIANVQFLQKSVKDSMTPRDKVVFVQRDELLGPLVLDDLHKTGHVYFPVIDKSTDTVIGVLDIEGFLTIEGQKRSLTAEVAMRPQLLFIDETDSLEQALFTALESKSFMLIVKNDAQQVAGILTMKDMINSLWDNVEDK